MRAIEFALTGSDQLIHTGAIPYFGFSIRETAGSTAVIRVYDGVAASGNLVDTISLAANESAREFYGEGGISCDVGLYVDVVSGTVEGSLRVG